VVRWLSLLVVAVLAVACDAVADEDTTTTTAAATTTTADATTTTTTEPPVDTVPGDEPETPERRLAAELPTARTEVAGAVWEGRIVVIGGLDAAGRAVAAVDVYDPETDAWHAGPDLPEPLHHTAVATLGDRVYVVGGYAVEGGRWVPRAEVWSLGPGDEAWRPGPPLGTPRGALAAAATGGGIVVVGGVAPGGHVLATTEILDVGADAWRPGPAMEIEREHVATTAVGDEVYAIAGRAGSFATNRASVEVLRGGSWHPVPDLNFSRGGIAAATIHGMPCVVGGEEPQGTIGSLECLVRGEWQVLAELELARHGLVMAAVSGALHVIGGGPQPGLTVSALHEVIPIPAP
jgi:N-acetylneuraminic acid mutarotase